MNLLTENQENRIVKNVVEACKNITKLNKQGYNYLYLCSGFIAHYNQGGFCGYYAQNSLTEAILSRQNQNQWNNFRPGEKDYAYYRQKANIYNRIVEKLNDQMLFAHNIFVCTIP